MFHTQVCGIWVEFVSVLSQMALVYLPGHGRPSAARRTGTERSVVAFSANPMTSQFDNALKSNRYQVHKCSIVRRRLLADDGVGEQLLQLQCPCITGDAACSAVLILAQLMSEALR